MRSFWTYSVLTALAPVHRAVLDVAPTCCGQCSVWSLTAAGPLAQLLQVAPAAPLAPIKQRIACFVAVCKHFGDSFISFCCISDSKSLELLMYSRIFKKPYDLPDYRPWPFFFFFVLHWLISPIYINLFFSINYIQFNMNFSSLLYDQHYLGNFCCGSGMISSAFNTKGQNTLMLFFSKERDIYSLGQTERSSSPAELCSKTSAPNSKLWMKKKKKKEGNISFCTSLWGDFFFYFMGNHSLSCLYLFNMPCFCLKDQAVSNYECKIFRVSKECCYLGCLQGLGLASSYSCYLQLWVELRFFFFISGDWLHQSLVYNLSINLLLPNSIHSSVHPAHTLYFTLYFTFTQCHFVAPWKSFHSSFPLVLLPLHFTDICPYKCFSFHFCLKTPSPPLAAAPQKSGQRMRQFFCSNVQCELS